MKRQFLSATLCALLTLSLSAQSNTATDNIRKSESARFEHGAKAECNANKRNGNEMRKRDGHQRDISAEDMARHRADKMKAELQLTDEQYNKVYSLYVEDAKKIKAIKAEEDAGKPVELSDEQKKARREEREAQMKEILTAEQFAKWKELVVGKRHHHPRENGPKPQLKK